MSSAIIDQEIREEADRADYQRQRDSVVVTPDASQFAPFAVGRKVRLSVGSPPMVVTQLYTDSDKLPSARCAWWGVAPGSGGPMAFGFSAALSSLQERGFPLVALTLVE